MAHQEPNYEGVPFADLRQQIDPPFCELNLALDKAYYGQIGSDGRFIPDTGWRDGASVSWHGFDAQETLEDSKARFELFHSLIWDIYQVVFHVENSKRAEPYERHLYDYDFDDAIGANGGKVAKAIMRLKEVRTNHPNEFNMLISWAQENGFIFDIDTVT